MLSFKNNVRFFISSYLHISSLDVWMPCYLGSVVVVTPFVLGKHTSVKKRFLEQHPSFDNLMDIVSNLVLS
jgi:hypothetical protein